MTVTFTEEEMINENNSTPQERADELIACAKNLGGELAILYFLNELANNTKHKNFDDKCYWMDVMEEFQRKTKYDN